LRQSFFLSGFGRTSTKNFVSVFERFGDELSWSGKYHDYSFTQLVELLPVKDNIEDYKPEMTVQAIRDQKLLEKAKSESKGFDEYLKKAFLLCGSFLSNAVFSDTPHERYPSEGEKNVSGTYSVDGVSHQVSLDFVHREVDGDFAARAVFLDKKEIYGYQSAETPSGLSLKLAAAIRKEIKERAAEKPEKEVSSGKAVKVPSWAVWYGLPLAKKLESVTKERILDGADKENPVFFLLNRDASVAEDGLILLTEETFYSGKSGYVGVPFRIYGLCVEGKIQDIVMVGIDGGGKRLFATETLQGIVDAVMRFVEERLMAKPVEKKPAKAS